MKKKLMIFNAAIISLGFIAAFLFSALQVQQQYREEFTKRLDTALGILSAEPFRIEENPDSVATQVSDRLAAAGLNMRVSIIDLNGKVVGDSEQAEINQNHMDRPEIQQALKNGRGYDTRVSASVGGRFYYEALYLPGRYFVRVALPTTDLDSVISRLWMTAAFSTALGILIVCVMTGFLVFRTTEPLRMLTETARRIAGGDYASRVRGEYRDEVGELARSFNSMAESTENAVAELTGKQNQLEGLLQSMADGVLAVGKNNEILFLNQSARGLLEKPAMRTGERFEGSLLISKISDLLGGALADGKSRREEVVGAKNEKHFMLYVSPINGPSPSALAVISDVTRMRRLEQVRSEFVANVTHELKTPLTSIRGSIDLLRSADRDEETRRYFYEVLDIEAERLRRLIDDCLVLSQIENAREDPAMRRCSVREELNQCVERLAPVAEKSGISLSLEADPSLFVACSPTRFQQLFCNLIENGVKYNKPNGSVSITAQRQRQTALIRVRDTGIGIAPEHFDRLFERFYRVDTSRSREIGGTGLGLSIVKHIAALYGGEVAVESEVGKGSVFSVWFPLLPADGTAKK